MNESPTQSTVSTAGSAFPLRWGVAFWRRCPSLVNNPVILRELVSILRRPSAMIQLAVFVGLLSIVFLMIWGEAQRQFQHGFLHPRTQQSMFVMLNLVAGGILMLYVPIRTASCINIERERDTWELIRTTPLSLASIVVGKFLSAMASVLILLVSMLPLYGLLFPLGGVSPFEIVFFLYVICETAVVIGLAGLLCSIMFRQVIASITATYVIGLVYLLGTMFAGGLWQGIFSRNFSPDVLREFHEVFYAMNPVAFAVWVQGASGGIGPLRGWVEPYVLHIHLGFILLVCISLAALCMWQLARQGNSVTVHSAYVPQSRRQPSPTDAGAKTGSVDDHTGMNLISGMTNPVYAREIRSALGSRFVKAAVSVLGLFCFSILLLLALLATNTQDTDVYQATYCMTAILLVPLLVLPYGVNMIRGERDRDQWDLLATTTLTSSRILWGKFCAGFQLFQIRFWSFFAIYCGIVLLMFFSSFWSYEWYAVNGRFGFLWRNLGLVWTVILTAMMASVAASMYLMMCAWISLYMKDTLTSYVVSFASLMMIYLGFFVAYMVIMGIFGFPQDAQRFFFHSLTLVSPPYLFLSWIEGSMNDFFVFRFVVFCGIHLFLAQVFFWLGLRKIRLLYENCDG